MKKFMRRKAERLFFKSLTISNTLFYDKHESRKQKGHKLSIIPSGLQCDLSEVHFLLLNHPEVPRPDWLSFHLTEILACMLPQCGMLDNTAQGPMCRPKY